MTSSPHVTQNSLPTTKANFPRIRSTAYASTAIFLFLFLVHAFSLTFYQGSLVIEYGLLISVSIAAISVVAHTIRTLVSKNGTAWAIILSASYLVFGIVVFSKYTHPTENLNGGQDEGVYAITSISTSQNKTYRLNSKILTHVPDSLIPLVTRETPTMANRSLSKPQTKPTYHTSFFIRNFSAGSINSQFPIGYPVFASAMHTAFEFEGMQWLNPLLMGLNALLLALIASRALGMLPAHCVFILSLLFPLNIWISNSFFAEPLLQTVWLTACIAFLDKAKAPASQCLFSVYLLEYFF